QQDIVDQTAIGYTIEQYEQSLRAREQELRAKAKPESGKSEEQRKAIERQLQAVQGELGNLRKNYEERVAELNRLTAELEDLHGNVPDAELLEALDAIKKAFPLDNPALATAYNNLAFMYRQQGRLNEAEPFVKKAVAIDEQALPAGHP